MIINNRAIPDGMTLAEFRNMRCDPDERLVLQITSGDQVPDEFHQIADEVHLVDRDDKLMSILKSRTGRIGEVTVDRRRATELTIARCQEGGYMVYGPAEVSAAFQCNRPIRPLIATTYLTDAVAFISDEFDLPVEPNRPRGEP